MLKSLPPLELARPIGMRPSPSPPRDTTGSPHHSPRPSPYPLRPETVHSTSRPTTYNHQRDDATLRPYQSRHAEDTSVAHDADKQERTPSLSRQTYHSPFASYSWSRYRPNSKDFNSPPLLYVEYRHHPLSMAEPGSLSGSFSSLSSTSRKRGGSSSSYPTSLSAVTASINSARERTTPYPRPAPVRQTSSESVTVVERSSQDRISPSGDRDLQKTFRRLEINAQNPRARRRPGGSPSWPYSSESESSSSHSPVGQGSIGATRQSTADPEADEWTRYAKALEGCGSSAQYACTWIDPRDDILERPCGYISKKHLVKRHIESKHLQIKPITCEVCGKGFSQRTNYSTHMNTHTGAAPHKCPFEGCSATFGDPARRHRHMKTVHNHQPSKRRTQSDQSHVLLDMDVSEPEEEDSP